MAARNYSDIAVATTLASGMTDSDTTLTVVSASGWPAAPFLLVIDPDTANEEVVLVGNKSGTTFSSLTRGFAGTSALAHNASRPLEHVITGVDIALIWTHAHSGDFADVNHANLIGVGVNDHHARDHDLVGATHTASGLTVGHALLATSDTAFGFGLIDHGAIGGLADDDHALYHTDARALTWLNSINPNVMVSGAATDGQVLTADGAGAIAWESIIQDHGGLTGLADDDHAQYHTDARAVTWHDADDHSGLSAAQITTGKLPFDQLPTGTGSNVAAIGNHLHPSVYLPLTGGNLSGPLYLATGTVDLPSLAFISDGNTGFYVNGANDGFLRWSGNGTFGGFLTSLGIKVVAGSQGSPSVAHEGQHNTGIYFTATQVLWTTQGVTGGNLHVGGIRTVDGSLSAPAFAFVADTDTGIYRVGTNQIGIVAGGAVVMAGTATAVQFPNAGTTTDNGLPGWRHLSGADRTLNALTSSKRYKKNIQTWEHNDRDLERINKLRIVQFNSKLKNDDGRKVLTGVIAEESDKVFPHLTIKDAKGRIDGFSYEGLTIPMLAAIQALTARVEALEAA